MAFMFYSDEGGWDENVLDDEMYGRMIAMDMLYNTLMFTAAAMIASSLTLKYFDNVYFRGAKSEKSPSP